MNDKEKSASQEKNVQDRLRMMHEVEKRNDERVKEWSGEHEQDGNGS